jgi:putative transposase
MSLDSFTGQAYPETGQMARKTFKFRLYPNRQQRERFTQTLDVCRELYNAGLQERIAAWKNRTPVKAFDQINQLPDIKELRPDVASVFSQVLQDTLRRLDKTYKAFFGQLQRGQKAGFPRFKGCHRYNSFTYPQSGFALNGKLQLSKIGNIKIKQHRPIVGEVKTLTLRREAGNWYACFSVEYTPTILPRNGKAVGMDVGLESFATLSDGRQIKNPRYYQKAQKQLRRAQRKVARRANKKSKRRGKAIVLLQKAHAHVRSQRKDFQHKLAYQLVQNFGRIVVEDLNIKGLAQAMLSKAVHDVGWTSFLNMLEYKAENAGRQVLKVDPRYSSQECPACHAIKKKSLGERVHQCECGLTVHRDHAAALLILGRGLRLHAQTKPEVRASVA